MLFYLVAKQYELRTLSKSLGLKLKRRTEENELLNKKINHVSSIDDLTGIKNRKSFIEETEKEIFRSRRHKEDLSLLVLDIDFFKKINEDNGIEAGDVILKEFCRTCIEKLRKNDTIARVGGEELAILLPQTDILEAELVAEKLRKTINRQGISYKDKLLRYTISIGVAYYQGEDLEALISKADYALYEAKSSGRNRVVKYTGNISVFD